MHLINKRWAPSKRQVRINASLRGRVLNKCLRRLIDKIRYAPLFKRTYEASEVHEIEDDNISKSCSKIELLCR